MDILLSKVTQQAMNYAIRSGIAITGGYAMKQCSRLLKTVDNSTEKQELAKLQLRLESKIRIISPAIDMIELISARGNTSLESAVTLTKDIRWEIQSLGVRLARAAGEEELMRRGSSRAKSRQQNDLELKLIIVDIKKLLDRIEDAVPLINLAITTSGANLSNSLPATVSPSRLLQASTFLTAGDSQYSMLSSNAVQIGPTFTLSMYMLFSGHIRPHDEEGIRETTWKEVMHKARVKLMRVPQDSIYDYPCSAGAQRRHSHLNGTVGDQYPSHVPSEGKAYEFAYQILIIEDLDDDRVHTFEEGELQPGLFEGVALAGIREVLPIHEISKIFYADTGKILNIGSEGEANNPILLLKRDPNAVPPRRMMERQTTEQPWYEDEPEEEPKAQNETSAEDEDEQDEVNAQLLRESSRAPDPTPQREEEEPQTWRLPPDLDPEWIAFEVYLEPQDSDDEEGDETEVQPSPAGTPDSPGSGYLTAGISNLNLRTPSPGRGTPHFSPPPTTHNQMIPSPQKPTTTPSPYHAHTQTTPGVPAIRTSLSLLEMLIRLTALQQFQQSSHLAIPDELLTFFLSESSTVGAGGDADRRRRVRRDAARRVGFDPYDESPIKRRGEEYLEHRHGTPQPHVEDEGQGEGYAYQYPYEYGAEEGVYDDRGYLDPHDAYASSAPYTISSPSPSPSIRRPLARGYPSASPSPAPVHGYRRHKSESPLPHPDVPVRSREQGSSASPLLRKAVRPGGGVREVRRGSGGMGEEGA